MSVFMEGGGGGGGKTDCVCGVGDGVWVWRERGVRDRLNIIGLF